ncbi:tubulin polyglutamylase TTLL4-like [Tropilaelaps mercedesae]|uniref:Tubulin polyglutamylase TTLL4-like n=1 Tax=Tropilaelaps mercedesae TaxID=418985 RepID=A0A1V9XSH0_9ACAR|nr:tubulin polyglutamylase TTLL4-like [Tropilaelaps mercedesae]
MSVSTEVRHRFPGDGEPKSDSEKTTPSSESRASGASLNRGNRPLIHIEVPKGVWALLSLTFACSVTLLYVNVDMRSISIDEFKQIKNITVNQAGNCERIEFAPGPIAWLHGKGLESGYLRHVVDVFQRVGYRVVTRKPPRWDVLWSHEYPFGDLSYEVNNLTPGQRVNHIPGTGYITNKVSLATGSSTKTIPTAFKLPRQKQEFLAYARANPKTLWVQKSNSHRGIVAKKAEEVELHHEDTFVQEFIENPLLVDGYKFDIGVYVVMTSVKPLRVYMFEGDALLRFCSKPYDKRSRDLDTYVVGDNYLPIWEVPSLKAAFTQQKFSMKESLNSYLRQNGLNPEKIWGQIRAAVSSVYFDKQRDIDKASRRFSSTTPFFEMVRFDFLVDSQLGVHLLEANMSPNLSSAHFKQNARLYEQVIYNLLSVTGLTSVGRDLSVQASQGRSDAVVSDQDLVVYPSQCVTDCSGDGRHCASSELCSLCAPCWDDDVKEALALAFTEHMTRGKFRRLIPVPERDPVDSEFMKHPANRRMYLWFEGKCQLDETFCS